MTFIWSFIIGGIVCLVAQVLAECKIPRPLILVGFIVIGGILTPFGIIDKLAALGPGGINSMALGPGNAGTATTLLLLSTGVPVPLIMVAILIVLLILMGALAGNINYNRLEKDAIKDSSTAKSK